jgi:hypothetical protein
MSTPVIDAAAWHDALLLLPRRGFDRLLIVQCSLDWLRPSHQALREEIDDFVLACCTDSADVRVDRVILHNLPTRQGARDGDLADLNEAHAEWVYRLASTSLLLHRPALRIHRLIVDGGLHQTTVEDLFDLRNDGSWLWPERSRTALELLSGGRRTTPLTGYDVDVDGPFGDTDPSVYI